MPKIQILQPTADATHLLKLRDKIYQYEMYPTRPVNTREHTQDVGWTDGQTDRRMDGRREWNQYTPPPQQLRWQQKLNPATLTY